MSLLAGESAERRKIHPREETEIDNQKNITDGIKNSRVLSRMKEDMHDVTLNEISNQKTCLFNQFRDADLTSCTQFLEEMLDEIGTICLSC